MKKARWFGTLVAVAMIVAACGSGDSGTVDAEFEQLAGEESQAEGGDGFGVDDRALAEGEGDATEGSAGDITDVAVTDRKVIRTGQITVEADDTRALMNEITDLVNASGGYVSASQVSPTGEDRQPAITITIRVPADDLDDALASIRSLAHEVVSESIQSQDVTEEYVDIESRLRNLEALETELLALLNEVRQQPDADPQKLLSVFTEVSRVRGEIEVLEGRRRLLDNQASLSTITVTIEPTPSSEPIVEEGWQPLLTVRGALGDLVDALQSLGDAAIWFGFFALPVLLVLAIPVVALIWILRRVTRRRVAVTNPEQPEHAETASASAVAEEPTAEGD